MLLYLNTYSRQIGPIRGNARYIVRLARRIERICQHPGIVLAHEADLTPSQRSVLGAIADQQERELRELLEPAQ